MIIKNRLVGMLLFKLYFTINSPSLEFGHTEDIGGFSFLDLASLFWSFCSLNLTESTMADGVDLLYKSAAFHRPY